MNNKRKNTAFRSIAGRQLAEMLARYIVKNEPTANRDECIDEFRELVCEFSDETAKAPVSALIKAEDLHRLKKRAKEQRYLIHVQEA